MSQFRALPLKPQTPLIVDRNLVTHFSLKKPQHACFCFIPYLIVLLLTVSCPKCFAFMYKN